MIKSLFTSLVVLFLLNSPLAAENRMHRLQESDLISTFEEHDKWEVSFTSHDATYLCVQCTPLVTGYLKVESMDIDPADFIRDATPKKLEEICATFATNEGQCISSSSFEMRNGAISVYRFEMSIHDNRSVMLLFPYRENGGPQEMITGILTNQKDAEMPDDLEQTLLDHMLKLTSMY